MALTKEDFIKEIETMTVIELNDLVEALKEKFGVTGAPVAAAGAPAAAAEVEEKTAFDVVLKEAGANKIAVIKEIKAITGLGLKESKDVVDNPGQKVKEGVSKSEAADIKAKLTAAGAVVEII